MRPVATLRSIARRLTPKPGCRRCRHDRLDRRELDESGLSLWTVLAGLMLAALITAFFVIPNLLGARNSTQDAAAQHNLGSALTAAKTYFAQGDTYTGVTSAALNANEPTLTFEATGTPSTGPKSISYAVGANGNSIVLAAKSATGKCWMELDVENTTPASAYGVSTSGDYFGVGGTTSSGTTPTTSCTASADATPAGGTWVSSFAKA